MKKLCLLELLTLSLSLLTIGCANASSPVCSLEIENTLSEEIMVAVGQVKILSDNNGTYYTYDYSSIDWYTPTENTRKSVPWIIVQGKEIIKIFDYPGEGYSFFISAQVGLHGPSEEVGIHKYAKKVSISVNENNQMIISTYPELYK